MQHQRLSASVLVLALPLVLALAGCGSASTSSAAPKTATTSVTSQPNATPTPSPTPIKAKPQTFVLTEHDTKVIYTPKGGSPTAAGPQGQPKPGDRLAVTAQILRASTTVGSLSYTDDFAVGNKVLIKGTMVLANGSLTVDGLVPLVEPTVIPVLSGTGAYAGLTGKLTAAGVNAHDAKLTFVLR